MNRIGGVLIHILTVVAVATVLAVTYQAVMVYVLGQVDPKFGRMGTVQLAGFMALASSAIAGAGSGASHWLWLRKRLGVQVNRCAMLAAVLVGALVALLHRSVLFELPLLSSISDVAQHCLYFFVLGLLLHRISVLVLGRIGRAQQGARGDREDAAPQR